MDKKRNERNERLRVESGEYRDNSRLVNFLYLLLRDYLPSADVETILRDTSFEDTAYSNGYIALYAKNIAKELTEK